MANTPSLLSAGGKVMSIRELFNSYDADYSGRVVQVDSIKIQFESAYSYD